MKFTKKLVTVAAALCAASALFLTGCSETEDDYGILKVSGDNCTIDFTNDTDVIYARAFKTTKTKHLSADVLVEIDTAKTTALPARNAADTDWKRYTVGYVFDLQGSGTEQDPYSFALVGLRYESSSLNYFVSYFTGVLSEDVSSNNGNFVVAADSANNVEGNIAVEYELTGNGGAPIDVGKKNFAKDGTIVSVFIDVDAVKGTEIVEDEDEADGYAVTLKKSANDTSGDFETVYINKERLNSVNTARGGKVSSGANLKFDEFVVDQAKLGYYAMVKQETTLSCEMTMSNTVKSASTGDAIIWDEEITNVR